MVEDAVRLTPAARALMWRTTQLLEKEAEEDENDEEDDSEDDSTDDGTPLTARFWKFMTR